MQALTNNTGALETLEFDSRPLAVPITMKADHRLEGKLGQYKASSYTESVLYDIFLAMNLSLPGSCDFYSSSLGGDDGFYPQDFRLNCEPFEAAYLASFEGGWPPLTNLPLGDVVDWISGVRTGFSQIPKNPAEKALFALLHLGKIDVSPISIIWVFYALEALFDAKVGENSRAVRERVCLLLEADSKRAAYLKKRLKDLYSLRSTLVHGGLEVVHPMLDDGLDKAVANAIGEYIEATNFGVGLIVASIQALIRKGWTYPRFSERMEAG
jgi:hypothetical protein